MKTIYICTNFQNSELSLQAAESFLGVFPEDGEVIIVDNNSNERERGVLENHTLDKSKVTIVFNPENLGYFAGLNVGLDLARGKAMSGAWVFAGNNDLLFDETLSNNLGRLKEKLADYSVVAPNIITRDGVHQNPHVVDKIHPLRRVVYRAYYSNYFVAKALVFLQKLSGGIARRKDSESWKNSMEIFSGHGSCYLLTPKFFTTYERLPVQSFLYFEELFLSDLLARNGESVYYCSELNVLHLYHGSVSKVPRKEIWKLSKEAYKNYKKSAEANLFGTSQV